MIYLDNAATTGKKPRAVINAVNYTLRELSANPGRGGHTLSMRASETVYNARKKVADFFGAESEDRVIFTPSCTYSLNFAIKGCLKPNDHVIISSVEHNAVARPIEAMRRNGVLVDVAEVIFSDPEATLRSFERLINKQTKAIVCTHASNVTGEIMPIKALGALCRRLGIIFIVDAAQTAGVLPIDCQKYGIDFLCIAPHKGLYAPMGCGILIARAKLPFTVIEGGTGVASAEPVQPQEFPERLESGTLNLPAISAISAGIDFVNSKGMNNIYSSELRLIQMLHRGLSQIRKTELYADYPKYGNFVPVLSFNLRGYNSSELSAALNDRSIAVRGGLHCAPMIHKRLGTIERGTVRVSTGVFNSERDILYFLDVVHGLSTAKLKQ